VVHGDPVKNTDALANPEALGYFRDLPALAE
jgi:acetoacetyl-CoA synthetase